MADGGPSLRGSPIPGASPTTSVKQFDTGPDGKPLARKSSVGGNLSVMDIQVQKTPVLSRAPGSRTDTQASTTNLAGSGGTGGGRVQRRLSLPRNLTVGTQMAAQQLAQVLKVDVMMPSLPDEEAAVGNAAVEGAASSDPNKYQRGPFPAPGSLPYTIESKRLLDSEEMILRQSGGGSLFGGGATDSIDQYRRYDCYPHRGNSDWYFYMLRLFRQGVNIPKTAPEPQQRQRPESRPASSLRIERTTRTLREEFEEVFTEIMCSAVCTEMEGPDAELTASDVRATRETLWQNFIALRRIFMFYARLDLDPTRMINSQAASSGKDLYLMSKREFLTFLRDVQVVERNRNVLKMFEIMWLKVKRSGAQSQTGETSALEINLGEFLACALRVAGFVYAKDRRTSRLRDRFVLLMREHVVPYARKDDVRIIRDKVDKDAQVQDVLGFYKADLQRVFVKYAGLDHLERGAKRGAMGADLASINLNEFVKLVEDNGVLDARLTLRQVREAFVLSQEDPTETTDARVDVDHGQLEFGEFVEAMVRCAAHRHGVEALHESTRTFFEELAVIRDRPAPPKSPDTTRATSKKALPAVGKKGGPGGAAARPAPPRKPVGNVELFRGPNGAYEGIRILA